MDLPPLADRRPKPRKRVLFSGVVVYDQGIYSCTCKIRNLTTDGARISTPAGQVLPSEVYLINLHSQVGYKANVVWRRGVEAGLAFLSSFDPQTLADPEVAYLKRIWSAYKDRK